MKIVLFLLLTSHLGASTLCVSPSSSGSSNGADWNNALGPSFTPVRGNTYYFSDGSYGSKTWSVADSGGTLITVKKATIGDHVTPTGWTNNMGDGQAIFDSWTFSSDNWYMDGQTGGGPTNTSGHGILITNDAAVLCSFVSQVVTNITLRRIHFASDRGSTFIGGVKATTFGSSDITISYCAFTDIFAPPFWFSSATNWIVEYCYAARNKNTPSDHTELNSCIGYNMNCVWRWNVFDQIEGTACFAGVNSGISDSWKIYGNVFSRSAISLEYYWEAPPSQNTNDFNNGIILNNTIYNSGPLSIQGFYIQHGTNNSAYNNLFFTNDANLFVSGPTATDFTWAYANFRSSAGNQNKDPEIVAGQANAQTGTMQPFTRYNDDPTVANLSASTMAGTNTSSMVASNGWDMFGTQRLTWSRGAVEVPTNFYGLISSAQGRLLIQGRVGR